MGDVILALDHVVKTYEQGSDIITALPETSLTLRAGEVVALVGASGAGKSTLLHIAGLLMSPTSGRLIIAHQDCSTLTDTQATLLRRQSLGFVYQFHHLLPELNAAENVAVPLMLNHKRKHAIRLAHDALEDVGLSDRAHHMPSELSGGQQQRVAIARALVHQPQLLLADEPTGNLDPETSEHVEQLMVRSIKRHNAAALIATHNMALAHRMDRIITLGSSKR